MKRTLVGVIGGSLVDESTRKTALGLGGLLARRGCTVVCGGLGGVMEAASRGAVEAGGDVVGILPGPDSSEVNPFVTHPVVTAMGHARNVIIAHTAQFLVAVGGEMGTLSEIAVSLKLGKTVYSLGSWDDVPGVIPVKDLEDLEDQAFSR